MASTPPAVNNINCNKTLVEFGVNLPTGHQLSIFRYEHIDCSPQVNALAAGRSVQFNYMVQAAANSNADRDDQKEKKSENSGTKN